MLLTIPSGSTDPTSSWIPSSGLAHTADMATQGRTADMAMPGRTTFTAMVGMPIHRTTIAALHQVQRLHRLRCRLRLAVIGLFGGAVVGKQPRNVRCATLEARGRPRR